MDLSDTNISHGKSFVLSVGYDRLVEALGEPERYDSSGMKVDAEWRVVDEDTDRTLNVWNYKNGPNYMGEDGTPVEDIDNWSAGGSQELAEELGLLS